MERILLVEPNYKNKYPPIGLMKISTYFKNRGDYVEFHKGLLPQNEIKTFNKVFITTLFTFDFDMCIQTIRYYIAVVGIDNVLVGGVAATIMPKNFKREIPGIHIVERQITSSSQLNYDDNVVIDLLELDYDMLWDIRYEYPAADSYFIYTTRGCPRKCSFCAVKTLEPRFYDCDNVREQVISVDNNFGIKRNLLIMDNNILYSDNIDNIVDKIKGLGFASDNNVIKKCNNMKYYLSSLERRLNDGRKYECLFDRIKKDFANLVFKRINRVDSILVSKVTSVLNECSNLDAAKYLLEVKDSIVEFYDRYNYHNIKRYVDFNQGLDARLFTDSLARKLGELAINPCRIAFDDLSTRDDYFNALNICVRNGITRFSNYLLYNYKEKPEDLWTRMYLNIQFYKNSDNVTLFSFPMKYAAIDQTDRLYIGQYWNRKYLRAMNIILNVTSGVVAKEEDFFLRAYGSNESEFHEILSMPDEFIRYRDLFEKRGLTQIWKHYYRDLSVDEKNDLISILEKAVNNPDVLTERHENPKLRKILYFYTIRKRQLLDNEQYYINTVDAAKKEIAI